jgi:hypothetical protein
LCFPFPDGHDAGGGNPNAHIMLTMRPFEERGEWRVKQKKEYIQGILPPCFKS